MSESRPNRRRNRGEDRTGQATPWAARMFLDDVRPGARFVVVSEPLDYHPRREYQPGEAFLSDLYWNDFETRVVRYVNTGERVLFFPAKDAAVREGRRYALAGVTETDLRIAGLVRVRFRPVDGRSPDG